MWDMFKFMYDFENTIRTKDLVELMMGMTGGIIIEFAST